jgi:hypothetical protein
MAHSLDLLPAVVAKVRVWFKRFVPSTF